MRGGDECCGRNLHRTGCRPLHDHAGGGNGEPTRRNERHPPLLVPFVRFAHRVPSRRVEYFMHFTYFAYEHADVKPAAIRALGYIAGTDESDVSNNNAQWLSERSAEIAFCPRDRKWFRLVEGMPLLSRFATITASPKLRTRDDINGIPAHFTSISKLLGL